jgi:hypothetical protein
MERDFDILLRLQILEGAAGVPADTWMKLRRRGGLAAAQSHFEDQGQTKINPDWFSPSDQGVFSTVNARVSDMIRKLGLRRVQSVDIINGYLMGLGVNLDAGVKRPAYAAGQSKADGILGGTESPLQIAKGPLSKYFVNKVWPEQRKQKDDLMPQDDEGRTKDYSDEYDSQAPPDFGAPSYSGDAFGEFLAETVFRNLHNPVGVKVRDLMRSSWHNSPPMLQWLDIVETEHRYPTQKEVAEKAGIGPSPFRARHWAPRWKKFMLDLRRQPTLLKALKNEALEDGIVWDDSSLHEMDPDSLLTSRSDRPRPRSASMKSIRRSLVARYLQRWYF